MIGQAGGEEGVMIAVGLHQPIEIEMQAERFVVAAEHFAPTVAGAIAVDDHMVAAQAADHIDVCGGGNLRQRHRGVIDPIFGAQADRLPRHPRARR